MCSTDVIYIVDYAIWKEHETSETIERTKKHSILCFMFASYQALVKHITCLQSKDL